MKDHVKTESWILKHTLPSSDVDRNSTDEMALVPGLSCVCGTEVWPTEMNFLVLQFFSSDKSEFPPPPLLFIDASCRDPSPAVHATAHSMSRLLDRKETPAAATKATSKQSTSSKLLLHRLLIAQHGGLALGRFVLTCLPCCPVVGQSLGRCSRLIASLGPSQLRRLSDLYCPYTTILKATKATAPILVGEFRQI